MADRNQFLVSFENVSASVGGIDISAIVELHLTAPANDIPQITLLVDAGASGEKDPDTVDPVSLDNARQIIETCRSMVKRDGSTLSLSVTCRAQGPYGGDVQTLYIQGWILTDVSLSPIQHGDVCTASLTFMHPICKSHFGGAVPGLLASPPNLAELSGGNPLEVFLSALDVYGSEASRVSPRPVSVAGSSSAADVRERLLYHLLRARDALAASLSWTGGGLPAETQLAAYEESLRKGLSCYAWPDGGTSVFQRFSRMMVPECSLAIGGDYTKAQLEVGPNRPWDDPSVSIRDSDIVSLQFPQSDPAPLSGVKIDSVNTMDAIKDSWHYDSCQVNAEPSEIFYVPQSELDAEYLYGPIQHFQEPGWLGHMRNYEQNGSDALLSDVYSDTDGNYQTAVTVPEGSTASFGGGGGSGGGDDVSSSLAYGEAMLSCAKAYYETSLMKDWSFTVNTRLLLSSGSVICPGRVLSVSAGSGSVIAGYVTSVTHSISVLSRSAMTSITCTHPRFGARPDSVTSAENALYT